VWNSSCYDLAVPELGCVAFVIADRCEPSSSVPPKACARGDMYTLLYTAALARTITRNCEQPHALTATWIAFHPEQSSSHAWQRHNIPA